MTLTNIIIFYIITLLTSLSLVMTYFYSNLGCLVIFILKKLGYKKDDPMYYKLFNDQGVQLADNPIDWTVNDFNTFLNFNLSSVWSHLLQCIYCLTWHVVLWVNIIAFLYTIIFVTSLPFTLLFVCVLTQPCILYILNKSFTQND